MPSLIRSTMLLASMLFGSQTLAQEARYEALAKAPFSKSFLEPADIASLMDD